MKRKLLSVLLALVLVCSFSLVMAVPVAATPVTQTGNTITVDSLTVPYTTQTEEAFNAEPHTTVVEDVAFDAQTSPVIIEGKVSDLSLGAGWLDTAYVEIGLRPEDTDARNAGIYLIAFNVTGGGTRIHLQDYTGNGNEGGADDYAAVIDIPKDSSFRYKITLEPSGDIGGTATLEVWVGENLDPETTVPSLAYGYASDWVERNSPDAVGDYPALAFDEDFSSAHLFYSIIAECRGGANINYSATVGDITIDDTLYVGVGQEFATIQDAINAAVPGHIISVAAGTYDEDQDLVISVALTLKGAQFGVDPTGTGRTGGESEIIRITIKADGVTIDGFTVSSPGTPSVFDGSEQSATIFVDGHDNCVIQNNIISGNHIGINLYGQYDPVGEYSDHNLVTKNLLTASDTDSKYGIKVKGEYNTITDNELLDWTIAAIHITSDRDEGCSPDYNVISGNFIDGGDLLTSEIGIWILSGSHLTISDNYITGVEGIGISLQDDWTSSGVNPPTDVTVSGNTITDLTGTDLIGDNWANSFGTLYGSIGIVSRQDVTGNTFTGNTISGVYNGFVFQKYDNIVNYNNIEGGLVNEDATGTLDATLNWWGTTDGDVIAEMVEGDVDYEPWFATENPSEEVMNVEVVRVEETVAWSETIQAAVDTALAGDTINVAAGTYVESPTVTVPLNLMGFAGEGGALPTLVGTLTINSISMLIDNMNFLVPEGITGTDDSIVLQSVDGVTISNCSFDGNESFIVNPGEDIPLGPRAVQMYPRGSNVTIDTCTFKDGYYTAISGYADNVTVTDSSIENCKSGINLQGGNNLVVENTAISVIAQGEPDTYCVRFASASTSTNMNITGGIFIVDKDDKTPEVDNYHSAIIVRAGATGTLKVEGVSIGGEVVNLSTTQLDATNNWWGGIGGPSGEGLGNGDSVSANVLYDPWLTEDFDTVITDGIRSYGSDAIELQAGWNTLSVPCGLKTGVIGNGGDTFGKIQAMGDYLISSGDDQNYLGGYWFDAVNTEWVGIDTDTTLEPGKGFYIRMKAASRFPVLYFDGNLYLPSYRVYEGWNLVGSMFGIDKTDGGSALGDEGDWGVASVNADDDGNPTDDDSESYMDLSVALNSLKAAASVVVSPSVPGQLVSWAEVYSDTTTNVMCLGEAYWVFMTANGTLAGFEVTPFYFTWEAP